MLRQDGDRGAAHREKASDERRVCLLEVDDDRMIVASVNRLDVVVSLTSADEVAGVHDLLPRVDHVVRGERSAVLPFDAAPKVIDYGKSVAGDVAVGQRWDTLCKFGLVLVLIVPIVEIAGPEHRNVYVDRRCADERVERVGLVEQTPAQHACDGVRIASDRRRAGLGRDFRAPGRCDRSRQNKCSTGGRRLQMLHSHAFQNSVTAGAGL